MVDVMTMKVNQLVGISVKEKREEMEEEERSKRLRAGQLMCWPKRCPLIAIL